MFDNAEADDPSASNMLYVKDGDDWVPAENIQITKKVSPCAFLGCKHIKHVDFPDDGRDNAFEIGTYSFYHCDIEGTYDSYEPTLIIPGNNFTI